MPISTLYSQDSTKVVKRSTLVKFKRFADKCDSMKVAFENQKKELYNYTQLNLKLVDSIIAENTRQKKLSTKLEETNKALIDSYKNPFGNITSLLSGGLIGVLITLLLVAF